MRIPGLVALCVLVFATSASPAPEGRPSGTVRVPFRDPIPDETSYFGLYHERQKVGWGMLALVREAPTDGEPRYVSRSVFQAEVDGIDVRGKVDFESVDVFRGVPPYELLRAWERKDDGVGTTTVRVEREDDAYRIVTETAAEVEETRVALDYSFVDRLTAVEWIRGRPAVGAAIAVSELDISNARPRVFEYELREIQPRRAGALAVEVFRVALSAEDRPSLGFAWIDAQGRPLVAPFAGRLEMRLESEAQARDLGLDSEAAAFGRAPVVTPLGNRSDLRRVVLGAFGPGAADLPTGPRVTVAWLPDVLEARVEIRSPDGRGRPATEAEIRTARTAARVDGPAEAALSRLARRVVGDAGDDRERVARLLGFLTGWMRPVYAPYETPVAVLLEEPAGDATEFARAFVALAGAAGVVARPVVGLVYVGDEGRAFEGHAWCEVLLDGSWVEIDPSLGLMEVTATHFPFARQSEDLFAVQLRSRHLQFEVRELDR